MSTAKTAKSPAAAPAADTVKQIEEAVAVHKEAIESVVKAGTDVASQGVDQAVLLTQDHVEAAVKAGAAAFQGYEDILQFSKDNIEALVKSSSIVARGMQDLSKSMVSIAQNAVEDSVATSKALIGARTLKEVIDLSSALVKSNFDKMVSESTRLGNLSRAVAEEALAPINNRVDAAVHKLTKTAA